MPASMSRCPIISDDVFCVLGSMHLPCILLKVNGKCKGQSSKSCSFETVAQTHVDMTFLFCVRSGI
jgi:hypothetical protein